MKELTSLVRPNIASLVPYASARTEYAGKARILLDANENPFGQYNRYPDPFQKELRKELATLYGSDPSGLFIGNGSDEVIDLCFRIFCRPGLDKAITFSPTYGLYEVIASIHDTQLINIPLNNSFQPDAESLYPYLREETIKLLILCSPNNPTGNLLNGVEQILEMFPGIVLLDEAYIDFADAASFIQKLPRYPNLVVTRTLSKAYGMAGIRIGMAFAAPAIIELFNKVKPPYNVSRLNQETALALLRNKEEIQRQKELLVTERIRLSGILTAEKLVEDVYPSNANFLLVRVTHAEALYRYLRGAGIVCRNRNSVLANCIRITIGTPEENNMLLSALRAFKQQTS